MLKARNNQKGSYERKENESDAAVFKAGDYESALPAKKKFRKRFSDLSLSVRETTEYILKLMKDFVKEDLVKLLSLIGICWDTFCTVQSIDGDKKLSEIGMMLVNGQDIFSQFQFDETDAVSIMHDMTLSKENSRVLKRYLGKHNPGFSNTNELLEARKNLKPAIKPSNDFPVNTSDLPGVAVDYEDLVKMTTVSIFDVVNHRTNAPLPQNVTLRLETVSDEEGKHVLWSNPSPNSANWCMPQERVREKEGNCLGHSIPYTERC